MAHTVQWMEMKMKTKIVKLKNLHQDTLNANRGTVRGSAMVEHSIRNYGAGRSVLVDSQNRIIAGNKTVAASLDAGMDEEAILLETDGRRLVVVKRTDVSIDSPEGRGLAIADNRASEVGLEWDLDALSEISEELDLNQFWFEGEIEIPELSLDELGEDDGLTDPDEVPEVEGEPTTKRGDVWILGDHRVMCGDSTNADDVARLMNGELAEMTFTDPPYGVNYTGGHFHSRDVNIVRKRENLENDADTKIYTDVVPIIAKFCDGPVYTWFAGHKPIALFSAVEKVGTVHSWMVWHKTNAKYAALNANYKVRHEPFLYWKPKKSTLRWCGASTESTLWEVKRDPVNTLHPTQKPVELAYRAISNHTSVSVLDLFLGSGSTLIAAEQAGRRCYGLEISEHYCDVVIKRWEEYTGKKAQLERAEK